MEYGNGYLRRVRFLRLLRIEAEYSAGTIFQEKPMTLGPRRASRIADKHEMTNIHKEFRVAASPELVWAKKEYRKPEK